MSNYFCLYCTEPRRRAAAVAYLKANAPKNGVIYKLYPNLAEMPQVFKDAHFGIEGPGFYAICFYDGDRAMVDPRKWCLTDVAMWSEIYSQDPSAARYFGRVAMQVMNVGAASKRGRVSDSAPKRVVYSNAFESWYYTSLARLGDMKYELDRMEDEYMSAVRSWQHKNAESIKRARIDRDRNEAQIRELAGKFAVKRYDAFKKLHPDFDPKSRNVYGEMFQEEFDRIRAEFPYKAPMDNVERILGAKPKRTPEHEELIRSYRELQDLVDRQSEHFH